MHSSPAKTPLTVVVNINPGPATPAQRAAWRRLWTKLMCAANDEGIHDGI